MLEKLKLHLENTKVSLIEWVAAFSGIVMVRFFLEAISSPTSSGIIASDAPTLMHYYLFYISVALALILILQYVAPEWRMIIPTIALYALTLTFLPPIFDWMISGGKGFTMAYIFQPPLELFFSFLTFFGSFLQQGITLGIRFELAVMLIGVFYFVYQVSKSWRKSLITTFVLYIVMFAAVSMPSLVSIPAFVSSPVQNLVDVITKSTTLANNIHSTLRYSSFERLYEIGFDFMMARIWFIITIVLAGTWFFTNFKEKTITIFRNSRPERTIHYVILIVIGIIVAYKQTPFVLNWNDWFAVATLILAFYFSWMFAVSVNDIVDIDIDRISNPDRPLLDNTVSLSDMKSAAFIFLSASLISAYLSGYYAFFCVLAFTALYYIYSAPPLRIKRVPFLSVVVIGFCSLTAIMAGFFTFSSVKVVSAFPAALIAGVVIFFSLLPQTKDIKDIDGDKKAGIMTLPTLFGPLWGPRVVGALAGFAYLIVPFVSHNMFVFIGSIPAGIATYLIAIRKPYKERPIFIIYWIFLVFLAVVLLH